MSLSLARWLHAWRQCERAPVIEPVHRTPLDQDVLRASDSIGLDGAPSMVFIDTMPPYSHALDRPSA